MTPGICKGLTDPWGDYDTFLLRTADSIFLPRVSMSLARMSQGVNMRCWVETAHVKDASETPTFSSSLQRKQKVRTIRRRDHFQCSRSSLEVKEDGASFQ